MKGVFCLEGFWYGDHRDRTSVVPIMEMANRYLNMPYIYHRCATVEEFTYSLERWKTKSFHKKYPILTLAFHGKKGQILIGKKSISLDELASILETKCEGVVIYFGSCETMNVSKRKLQSFMEKTRTIAVLGYKQEVDWLKSAAFEIQLLGNFLAHPFDTQGIKKIMAEINATGKYYIQELDFRMEINERVTFRRTRTKK